MSNIFLDNAPLYWSVQIPAMPLKKRSKVPILSEWQTYGSVMPLAAIRNSWLASYPDNNLGFPFGPTSGLCAIDIDTEDDGLIAIIRGVLPSSPWVRTGKKGMGLIYKWDGQKNFKIRGPDGMIMEHLGAGNQMVLPGSTHPDCSACGEKNVAGSEGVCNKCGAPSIVYTSDNNLWEVMDQILPLPKDIEDQLRTALGKSLGGKGITLSHEGRSSPLEVVPEGTRDIMLVRHAGYLAKVVRGIDKSARFTLLEAMQQMYHWVEEYTGRVSGDDMDPNKGVSKLLAFLVRDVEGGATLPNGWDTGLTEDQRADGLISLLVEKNASMRWTVERAKNWMSAQLVGDPAPDEIMLKIEELVRLVAVDENFSVVQFEVLGQYLRSSLVCGSMFKIAKPVLSQIFRSARQGDADMGADHEEIAQSVAAELGRGGDIRHHLAQMWQWNGSCYEKLSDRAIFNQVAGTVKGNVLCRRFADYTAIGKVIANVVPMGLVECGDIGINFANGFLDEDLVLREHSPIYGKTFTMNFNYIPERAGECHKWLDYLEMAWGGDVDYADKVAALQEAFAATMFGIAPRYQRVILLHGEPGTGKTRALEVLKKMMPTDAVSAVGPELWGERFGICNLIGSTLNVCGELPEQGRINGGVFKQIVEGGTARGEYKGKDAFDFTPVCAHWFASNHLPSSYDTSEGFSRRWLILDFNNRVPEKDRIVDFDQVLINEEQEAIAAWGVLGLKRLMAKGYTIPASSKMRENQILRSNNSVAAFLQSNEKVRPSETPSGAESLRDIFDVYLFYMRDISRGAGVSMEKFNQMLNDLGYKSREAKDEYGVMRYVVAGLQLHEGRGAPRKAA